MARKPLTFRYAVDRIRLLEAVCERRPDDETLSDTLAAACDALIEQHFPGALGP